MSKRKKKGDTEKGVADDDIGAKNEEYSTIIGLKKKGSEIKYLVKPVGKSYHHVVWVTSQQLSTSENNMKLLERDIKTLKSKPYFNSDYLTVDHIISKDENGHFLVKWKNLDYDEVTLEEQVDESCITMFMERSKLKYGVINGTYEPIKEKYKYQDVLPLGEDKGYAIYCYNYMLREFYSGSDINLYADINIGFVLPVCNFLIYLYKNMNIVGPFLIVVNEGSLDHWQSVLSTIDNFVYIMYANNAVIDKIKQLEFYGENDSLKFHAILTTHNIAARDKDLANIKWCVAIIDKTKTTSREVDVTAHCKVVIKKNAIRPNISDVYKYFELLSRTVSVSDDASFVANEFMDIYNKSIKKKYKLQESNYTLIKPIEINCPINQVQKDEILRATYDHLEDIKKSDFLSLADKILKILNHPYISEFREYHLNISFLECSYKLDIISEVIKVAKEENKKLLIISDSNGFIDLVEDLMCLKGCKFLSVRKSGKNEYEEMQFLLFNQKLSKLTDEFVRFLSNHVSYIVVAFADPDMIYSSVLKFLTSQSKLEKIYNLVCNNYFEKELLRFTENTNTITPEKIDLMMKKIVFSCYKSVNLPKPDELLKNSSLYKAELSSVELEAIDSSFWQSSAEFLQKKYDGEAENIILNNDPDFPTQFTARQRNAFFRALMKFGFNRIKTVVEFSGIRMSEELALNLASSIMTLFVNHSKQSESYKKLKDYVTDVDVNYMDNGVWTHEQFRKMIKQQSSYLNKTSELICVNNELNEVSYTEEELESMMSLLKKDPDIDGWEKMDNWILSRCFYRYGFGNYDMIRTDPEIRERGIFENGFNYHILDEHFCSVLDKIRKFITPPSSKTKNTSESKKVSKTKPSFPEETARRLRETFRRYGVKRNENGEEDWNFFREECDIVIQTNDEIKDFIYDYLAEIERSLKCKFDNGDEGKVKLKTAEKYYKQYLAINQVQEILSSKMSDPDLIRIIELALNKRFIKNFSAQDELKFLKLLLKYGFGYTSELMEENFKNVNTDYFSKDSNVVKRINKIYAYFSSYGKNKSSSQENQPTDDLSQDLFPKILKPEYKSLKKFVKENQITLDLPFSRLIGPLIGLIDLGKIYLHEKFSSSEFLYPVGYKIYRLFNHPQIQNQDSVYYCEIMNKNEAPFFAVRCLTIDVKFESDTHSGVHRMMKEHMKDNGVTCKKISSCEFWGFKFQEYKKLLRNLENAESAPFLKE